MRQPAPSRPKQMPLWIKPAAPLDRWAAADGAPRAGWERWSKQQPPTADLPVAPQRRWNRLRAVRIGHLQPLRPRWSLLHGSGGWRAGIAGVGGRPLL